MVYTMLISDWMGQTNKLFAFLAGILADITLSFRKGNKKEIEKNSINNVDKAPNIKSMRATVPT